MLSYLRGLAAPLVTLGALCGLARSEDVIVVDIAAGPGTDFENVSDAIAAAASGSIIVIRDGFYNGEFVFINGKALTLVGEAGAVARIRGQFVVQNLSAGETFTIANLTMAGGGNVAESLVFTDIQGTVWLDQIVVEGSSVVAFSSAHQVLVSNCDSLVVTGCTITGGRLGIGAGSGGAAIRATDSDVHVYNTVLNGGAGGSDATVAGVGGPGLELRDNSFLYAQSSTMRGGVGGPVGNIFGCNNAQAGDGGVGLSLTGSGTPDARVLDVTLEGGLGGVPMGAGNCTNGNPGAPFQVDAGALTNITHPSHGFTLTSPVRSDEMVDMTFTGIPGEFAWYLFSSGASTLFLEGLLGTLVLDFPLFAFPIGTLDGGGAGSFSAVPPLGVGSEGAEFFLQALFFDSTVGFTLSQGAALTVLDPIF